MCVCKIMGKSLNITSWFLRTISFRDLAISRAMFVRKSFVFTEKENYNSFELISLKSVICFISLEAKIAR